MHWIDNGDTYICPKCGYETSNPHYHPESKCPACGFQDPKDATSEPQMKIEPIPCPSCGEKAKCIKIPSKFNYGGMYICGCDTGMCYGNYNHVTMIFSSEENCVKAWNKRAMTKKRGDNNEM